MKNLIIKLTLIATLVVVCNSASAAYTDTSSNFLLWHCDSTNSDGTTATTPDDNSSGRTAHPLQINHGGEAVMMPGSPYGGSYLYMDGSDQCTAWGTYEGDKDNVSLNFSFRPHAFPAAGEYDQLLWTIGPRIYLYGNVVQSLTYDAAAGAHFITSSKTLSLDTWYSVSYSSDNGSGEEMLIVGNDTDGYTTNTSTALPNLYWVDGYTFVLLGWDINAGAERFANADFDEIRAYTIPEPITIGFIGLVGFLALRRRK